MLNFILWGAVILLVFWYFAIRPMSYWKKRGVKQGNPAWLFGDNWKQIITKESFTDTFSRLYKTHPGERYSGIYQFTLPALLIRDPELLKQVMVKDFDHFVDHNAIIPEDADELWTKNLFALRGQRWREMRPILSPSFTSSKMRSMYILMSECVDVFVQHFLENARTKDVLDVDVKDAFTRFGNDIIASAAFGVKVDSLAEPNNEFYLMGKEATNFNGFWKKIKFFGYFVMPNLYRLLKVKLFDKNVTDFFINLVGETVRVREEKKIIRPDMIHLLMEARKGNNKQDEDGGIDTGFATVEEADTGKADVAGKYKDITNIDIAAQALIFFFAGFDSVTTLMSFMAFELALHPDIQDRLRQEIEDTKEECGGKLNYEALMKMKYMDMVVSGQSWKEMRPILSPSFTTSKMKSMFVLMSDCVEVFVKHFTKMNQDVVEVEMKDILTRFANDVIASTAFGIQVDSLNQPKNEFFLMGKEATDFTGFWNMMKMFALVFMPNVCKLLSFRLFSEKVSKFFQNVVDETIRVREEKGIVRQDMIQLLMEARQGNNQREEDGLVDTGFATVEEADIGKVDIGSQLKGISNIDITAQALVFFFAGFESVTTLTSFMAYELAINPDIQDKLRREILKTKEKCGNTLDYDALMKMKYMDMVVSESLRKWPSNIVAERVCTKSYTIEPIQSDEVPVHLEKGSLVVIPIFGFHYDPKYYPNPEKFDPERFSEENKNNIKPYTYMPFGVGPRNCIGSRFALLEAKILFFHLLANFEIVPTNKTSIPIKLNQKSFSFAAENGLNLGLKRLIKN